MPLVKARLTRLSTTSDFFEFDFNPETLNYTIQNSSTATRGAGRTPANTGQGAGTPPSGGGQTQEPPVTTTPPKSGIQLKLSSTFILPPPKPGPGAPSSGPTKSVKERVDQLIGWTKPLQPESNQEMRGRKAAEQPTLVFSWGNAFKGMNCKLTGLTVTYVRFGEDGIPTAAKIDNMTLTEVPKADGRTNPTSGGIAPIRSHIVRAGDSLPSIAFSTYGEARYWRALARANDIDDPMRVGPGRTLQLPTVAELDGAL